MSLYNYTIYLITRFFFFFNDPAPTEIYTLSLHDALPISEGLLRELFALTKSDEVTPERVHLALRERESGLPPPDADRKSTRLNSSHVKISYAVFCLKKKKKKT